MYTCEINEESSGGERRLMSWGLDRGAGRKFEMILNVKKTRGYKKLLESEVFTPSSREPYRVNYGK